MINMSQGQPISPPLYGPQAPRDGLVQALMGGIAQRSPSPSGNAASGLAGLNPMAIAGLLKLLQPTPGPGTPAAAPGAITPDTTGLPPMGGAAIDYGAGAYPQITY